MSTTGRGGAPVPLLICQSLGVPVEAVGPLEACSDLDLSWTPIPAYTFAVAISCEQNQACGEWVCPQGQSEISQINIPNSLFQAALHMTATVLGYRPVEDLLAGVARKPFNFHSSHYSLPKSYATSLRQDSVNSVTDVYVPIIYSKAYVQTVS
eukprot:1744464-Rhodomonas_salina.3